MGSKTAAKTTQDRPKMAFRWMLKLVFFVFVFDSEFAPFGLPKCSHLGALFNPPTAPPPRRKASFSHQSHLDTSFFEKIKKNNKFTKHYVFHHFRRVLGSKTAAKTTQDRPKTAFRWMLKLICSSSFLTPPSRKASFSHQSPLDTNSSSDPPRLSFSRTLLAMRRV